jgi:hypothetical protein
LAGYGGHIRFSVSKESGVAFGWRTSRSLLAVLDTAKRHPGLLLAAKLRVNWWSRWIQIHQPADLDRLSGNKPANPPSFQ